MGVHSKSHRSWAGFAVGLLAVVVPLALFLLIRGGESADRQGQGTRPSGERGGTPAGSAGPASSERRAGVAPTDSPFPVAETFPRAAGASVIDPVGPIDPALLRASLRKAEDWLRAGSTTPYSTRDLSALRAFALEVECWHRLWESESDAARRSQLEREVVERLRVFAHPEDLRARMRGRATLDGVYEAALLAGRCIDHGIEAAPVVDVLSEVVPSIQPSLRSLAPSTAALFTAGFERIGLRLETPLSAYRSQGILAARPREAVTGVSRITGLTQEIWAFTGGGREPITDLTSGERAWLERALPHFALAASLLDLRDLSGDLLSCLHACGMRDLYGYREGIRILLERQNADGSFGGPSGAPGAAAPEVRASLLAPTSTCITALSLELRSRGGTGS